MRSRKRLARFSAERRTFAIMDAEVHAKKIKYQGCQKVCDWIESLTGVVIPPDSTSIAKKLRDGVVLCEMANAIRPGAVTRINKGSVAFKQMDNIDKFLAVCKEIGVAPEDLFLTGDLFEGQNIPQVISTLHALNRVLKRSSFFQGPLMETHSPGTSPPS